MKLKPILKMENIILYCFVIALVSRANLFDLPSLYTNGRDKLNMTNFLLIFRILATEVYCNSKHSRSRPFYFKVKKTS